MEPCASTTTTRSTSTGPATAAPARAAIAPTDATTCSARRASPTLLASADRPFFGDADRWNPEELLLAALASCHLLSYLHVAAEAGVVVTGYTDAPTGAMVQTDDGGGHFERVVLHPVVTVADPTMVTEASGLHRLASSKCFIASSVNFPVEHEPEILVG